MSLVRQAMEGYDQSTNDWKKYEFFDAHKKYTRNLVATDNETFTLMLLCWNPGKGSPIHDHAGSECFMRNLAGELNEVQYAWADRGKEHEQLQQTKTTVLGAGTVAYITGIYRHIHIAHGLQLVLVLTHCQ
jgi:cysteine dioxygenase